MKNEEAVRCSNTMDMAHKDVSQSLKCFDNTVVPNDGARGLQTQAEASLGGPDFLHSEVWALLKWEPQKDYKKR